MTRETSKKRRWRSGQALPLAFACGVLAGAALLHLGLGRVERAYPYQVALAGKHPREVVDDASTREKLGQFAREKDRYAAVFVGTSRTFHGIDPAAFGDSLVSFNFGVGGMNLLEQEWVIERIHELAPAKLRFVFIEIGLPLTVREENLTDQRIQETHDLEHTVTAIREIAAAGDRWPETARQVTLHSLALIYRLLNVGRLSAFEARLVDAVDSRAAEPDEPRRAGFLAADDVPGDWSRAAHQLFLNAADAYERDLRAYTDRVSSRPTPDSDARIRFEATRKIAARAEGLGYVPVLVAVPDPDVSGWMIAEQARALPWPLLRFDDPRLYPELFAARSRWNHSHLNREGARIFSAALARSFSAALDSPRASPPSPGR